jgi:hypothetical protein
MRAAGYVARTTEGRNVYKIWSENLKGTDYSEDLDVDGWETLESILGK